MITLDDIPALAETGQEIAESMDIGRQYTLDKSAAHPIDIEVWYTPHFGNLIFFTFPGNTQVMLLKGTGTLVNGDRKEKYKRDYCYLDQTQLVPNNRYKYENGNWHYVQTKKDHKGVK